MRQEPSDTETVIRDFVQALREQGLRVDKVILFGSRARGAQTPDSDIDLLVISPDFAAMPFMKRAQVLGTAIAKVRRPVDPLACTPEEVQVERLSKASFLYDVLVRQETIEYAGF